MAKIVRTMTWSPISLWTVTAPSVLGSLYAKATVNKILQQVWRPAPIFCIKTPVTLYLKGLLSLQSPEVKRKMVPLMTRSSKLLMLASAFSLTYGATMSLSDVYYLIMKRPFTESSKIFITSYDMNYFCRLIHMYVSLVHFGLVLRPFIN